MNANTMNTVRRAALLTLTMLAPTFATAQGSSATASGVSAGAQGQAQAQARTPQARIDAAMQAAAEANIPTELIKSKVAEGEAKRVPPERIATAVEARVTSLVRASETMKRADVEVRSAGELSVAADALDAGVSEGTLIRLTREAPAERRTVAVAVLADLVRLGNASDRALMRVSAALSSSAALANLHAEVASQLRLGGLTSTLDAAGHWHGGAAAAEFTACPSSSPHPIKRAPCSSVPRTERRRSFARASGIAPVSSWGCTRISATSHSRCGAARCDSPRVTSSASAARA